MKRTSLSILLTGALLMAGTAYSQVVLQDEYWGGLAVHNDEEINPRDVVGDKDIFDLTMMEVGMMDGNLNVTLYGNYFKFINPLTRTDEVLGTTLGDLFISIDGVAWTGTGKDTAYDFIGGATETSWEYAVVLGTYGAPGDDLSGEKMGSVHQIGDGDTIVQSDPGEYTTYRANQAVTLETQSEAVGDASWFMDAEEGLLSITIQDFGSIFSGYKMEQLGFHWTMSCGNDVLEGSPEVPEPATVGLLAVGGLLGVLMIRRRIRNTRK